MNAGPLEFHARLDEVRERIARTARRSGRRPEDVRLIGVVKGISAERVRVAIAAGLEDLGENRVQEAQEKIEAVGRQGIRWHMIGNLQRNKAARAVTWFDRVQTVDSVELAETLARHAVAAGRRLPVLVQINVTGEAAKHGIGESGLVELVERVAGNPGLAFDGLMSMGPAEGRADEMRASFARTRELRDRVERTLGLALPQLSMGMSGDFETAIEEGSTMVRVGSALFGPRVAHGKDP